MSNTAVALLVLGIMIGMALLGLGLALSTKDMRREHNFNMPDTTFRGFPVYVFLVAKVWILGLVALLFRVRWSSDQLGRVLRYVLFGVFAAVLLSMGLDARRLLTQKQPEPQPQPNPVAATMPADLAGLQFVPSDTNLILAVHLAEGMQQPLSRDLLSQLNLQGLDLESVDQMTGIKKGDIHHFLIETKFENRWLLPRYTLILRMMKPMPMKEIRNRVSFHKVANKSGAELYRIKLEATGTEIYFTFPDDETLIVSKNQSDLLEIVNAPKKGLDALAAPLQGVIRERLPRNAQAWFVGHSDRFEKTTGGIWVLSKLEPKRRAAVEKLTTFGLWLTFDEQIVVGAAGKCKSDAGAAQLAEMLRERDLLQFQDLKVFQEETWVSAQAKASKDEAETFLRFIGMARSKEE